MHFHFSKMHGLGNDFMVVDCITQNIFFSPDLIRRLADRHTGVGFDQLLVVEAPYDPETDFHYRIFNADGSEVEPEEPQTVVFVHAAWSAREEDGREEDEVEEAGFVEVPMSTRVLGKLMPAGWLALQRPTVRHYFAAVKLDGRWHGVDSSYDIASYRIYLEMFPWMAHRETPEVRIGAPYMPALEIQHADLFDIQVVDSIAEEMGKKSRFLTRHFEALNTCMDRARGTHLTWRKGFETPAAPAAANATDDEVRA